MRGWRIALAALAFTGAAKAQDASSTIVSNTPDAVAVAIYNSDLPSDDMATEIANSSSRTEGIAFITETRTLDLPAGPAVVRFRGVAATMVPQTASLDGLPAPVAERDFDYALLSPGSLLSESVGQPVHLVRTEPRTGKETTQDAILRSGPNGVLLDIGGKIEGLGCSGLPEKLVFDHVPEGLGDVPVLSMRTVLPVAGRYTVKLSYIATGLNWSADYVAHVRPDGRTLDLTGWITLANFGDTGFGSTPISVVAGKLNATGEDEPPAAPGWRINRQCWTTKHNRAPLDELYSPSPVTAVGQQQFGTETVVVTGSRIDPRSIGDYKYYPLPQPTILAAHQLKQVQFVDQQNVGFQKVYVFHGEDYSPADRAIDPAHVALRLENTRESGLGTPLPSGNVSVMQHAVDGTIVFAGQNQIPDTPDDLPIELDTGLSNDLLVEHGQSAVHAIGQGDDAHKQRTLEYSVVNTRPAPVAFEIRDYAGEPGTRILSESRPHSVEGGFVIWAATLAPGERLTLTYTIERPD